MKKFIFLTILSFCFVISCQKESDSINDSKQDTVLQSFYNVAKGDSISKDIFRDKPKFDSEVTILYSSEVDYKSNLKSVTPYITDLYILTSDRASATPPWLYTKIDVDLNEGAGGKWIFLCYTKESGQNPIREIHAYAGGRTPNPTIAFPRVVVSNSNGLGYPGTDLNEGSGGDWIYLYENRSVNCGNPIKEIAVVATTNSSYSPCCGWEIANPAGKVDLNKGAGGRFIYVIFKR